MSKRDDAILSILDDVWDKEISPEIALEKIKELI